MQWFRMYSEILQDPKVQRLPAGLFKHWVNLLALANLNEPRGVLPDLQDVAFALRVKPVEAKAILDKLVERGLLDQSEDGQISAHNWSKRQRDSDDSATRVRRHRVKNQTTTSSNGAPLKPSCNVTSPVTVTPPDTDTETDIEKDQKDTPAAAAAGAPPAKPLTAEYPADFEEFWSEYPRRTEKMAAYKAWKARIKGGTKPADMIAAARNYGAGCRAAGTEEQYIKHAATFLGPNRPFEEYVRPRPSPGAKKGDKYAHLIRG